YVDVARQTLGRISQTVQDLPHGQIQSLLASNAMDLPLGVVIMVYDEEGISVGPYPINAEQISIADRQYFSDIKAGKSWSISNLIVDRLTGSKTFAVAIALKQKERFSGAIVAYAPMSVLADAWLGASGRQSNAFLVHKDGWISARLPPVDSDVYDTKVSQEFVQSFAGARGAYLAEPSPIDGIARVLGYAEVPNTPLIAVVGLSRSEHLKPFWFQVKINIVLLLPMLALLFYAARKVRTLVEENDLASARLARSLKRNEGLLLEIHHRIKNNLQSVSSLVRLHVKDANVATELNQRIAGMAAVHEHIYRNETFADTSAREFIVSIVRKVLFSTSANHEVAFSLADIHLRDEKLMPIGQLLAEAIMNACKYGYPDGRKGILSISLASVSDDMAELSIHNDGVPLGDASGQGLGNRLMRLFAEQLGGDLQVSSNDAGVTITVRFPTS
ncbi:MAG: hypothetical protein KF874_15395, partial [Rhizobiaceae bacterium]|nr:hypothetical protein [Rhizobiaceae bacterium]